MMINISEKDLSTLTRAHSTFRLIANSYIVGDTTASVVVHEKYNKSSFQPLHGHNELMFGNGITKFSWTLI